MAASRRELILQAIEAALLPLGLPVFRSRRAALSSKAQEVYLVRWQSETPRPLTNGRDECDLPIYVSAFVAWDAGAETRADALMVQAHAVIMADRTFGGLAADCSLTQATVQIDEDELERCAISHTYFAEYQRASQSLG